MLPYIFFVLGLGIGSMLTWSYFHAWVIPNLEAGLLVGRPKGLREEVWRWIRAVETQTESILALCAGLDKAQKPHAAETVALVKHVQAQLPELIGRLEQLGEEVDIETRQAQIKEEIGVLREKQKEGRGRTPEIMQRTIDNYESLLATMEKLAVLQEETEYKIQHIGSILERQYAQLQLLAGRKQMDSNDFRRLNHDLQESSEVMNDLLEAFEELRQGK
ncbi:MAG TPA: hypothetical protein VLL52_14030 [Anaerolineae bacterium]|nr:hypothetical protein [Anaerolineae bacterium]